MIQAIEKCRICGSKQLTEILDLGNQRISDFRTDPEPTASYPLVAVICESCMLVQLKHSTPQAEMYHDNYGFKSGVSNSIKADLKEIVEEGLSYGAPGNWLDIASNDGTLLSYVPEEVYRVGVDPVGFLCKEAEQHADEIVNDYFSTKAIDGYSGFDVITSISCFYDMPDPNRFVADVAHSLKRGGIWIIQQNYLLPTMQLNAVDNFCHEHLEYYTLLSLEKLLNDHELEVIDVSTSMVNGGSIRTVVAHKDTHPEQGSVEKQRQIERDANLDTLEPYKTFGAGVIKQLHDLKTLVDKLNGEGKTIYILAASTRGATIWQGAGITEKDCPYAVERNPAKVGKYFNAVGMPIISEEEARVNKPDYMIIGPWFFQDEIIDREKEYLDNGGHLITPLPEIKVI